MDYSLPTEFDLIVVGTGIVESIVSAAASRVGKKVLQVDKNNYYGGQWASFNLEDINNINKVEDITSDDNLLKDKDGTFVPLGNKLDHLPNFQIKWHIPEKNIAEVHPEGELKEKIDDIEIKTESDVKETQNSEEQYDVKSVPLQNFEIKETESDSKKDQENYPTQESLKQNYRKFIIDLCPKLHFARGEFVELLISSNIARYAEFRSVSRVLTWLNGNLEIVPCSRSDVFANNKVSVVEKRMLMKLLTSIDEDEKNSTVSASTTYQELLREKKLSSNITHFVLYALSMSTNETLWLDGVKSTKRFLNSLGRFGKTPFLFSMYGSGEITQAFCRLSAVFGGIFALSQPLHGIILNKDNNFDGLICGNQRINASHIVMNIGMAPQTFQIDSNVEFLSRAIFITDRSLMNSEKEHLTLLLYPGGNNKLCTLLELGTLTGTCPKNLFLVHITTKGSSDPKKDFEQCVDDLFTFNKEESSEKPRILWSCYFSIPNTNEINWKSNVPDNVFLCPGPDSDLDYDLSVRKAKEIFASIYPSEEFLPRAPDADEIIIGEDPEPETAAEVQADPQTLDNQQNLPVISKKTELEQSSEIEIATEARASSSDLDTSTETDKSRSVDADGCSEAKEIQH